MQITNFYTGKDSAAKFPDLDSIERSSRRLSDLAIRAEEMKLEKKLKDKDTFLKMMKIDPVGAIASKDRVKQALMKEKFNNKWAERYKKANGELSATDLVELQMDHDEIDAQQNKIIADQKRLAEAETAIRQDARGYWDKNYFETIKQEYLTTDKEDYELPPSLLKINPQDFGQALAKADVTGTPSTYIEDVVDSKGNKTGYKQEYETRMSPQEAEQFIPQYALTNDAYMEDIMRKFESLPESEQMKVIGDYNGDGKVDPADVQYAFDSKKITEHPIMQWAAKNPYFQKQAMELKPKGVAKRENTGGSRTTFDWNVAIGSGHNQNNKFNVQPNISTATAEGKFTFPDYQNLGQVSQTSETQTISSVITSDGTKKPLNETASFHVVGFSPSKDQLIIQLDGQTSDYSYSKGDVLVVPASEFDDLLKKKPFGIYRNATQPIAQNTTTSPKMSFAEWRKANPNKPVSDYSKM